MSVSGQAPAVSTESSGARDIPRLVSVLYQRGEPGAQSQAALLLVQLGTPESQELVRQGLRRWDRPDVFQALTTALRWYRDAQYVPQLLQALACDQAVIRQSAIETLARLDQRRVLRPLIALAEDNQAPLLARQSAVQALGRTHQRAAIVPLISLLSAELPALREAAATALEELTGLTYGTDLARWQLWWRMHKDMTDEEWLAARNAALQEQVRRLQGELGRAEAHIVQLHQQIYNRTPLADRLSHFQTLVQSDYPAVRVQAIVWMVESLPELDSAQQEQITRLLLQLTEDGVEAVQRQAVLALEKRLEDPRVLSRLLTLLENGSVAVRAAAARSLGRFRAPPEQPERLEPILSALKKALADPSLLVVAEATESLGAIGAPQAAVLLAELLHHPSEGVRQAAARALEPVADERVLADLRQALGDRSASVRFHVLGALGRVGTAVPEVRRADLVAQLQTVMLQDGDPGVRSRAATVLGELGTPADLNFLWQRCLATEDERVQAKAWSAMIEILARSGNPELVTQWDQLLTNHRDTARRIEMLTELRSRWQKTDALRQHLDTIQALLVQAYLAQRRWQSAGPLALELARRAPNDNELRRRLRWLLAAGYLAVEDKRPDDALAWIREAEDLLARAGDLAFEFAVLRQRAHQAAPR
ncbi:MAG: HEAT repeat domain-containing protein [Gemmatales bacterium]|nr:HEAT repeat domain-containing protein [Gemmatales bacterium]MCS7159645.1 HEAT repeat domain-containing protein [Gemmatales bacterium]MDW8174843.1 HEAT repeat domain-containing protein [Gemmatales bacterium]MDW8223796.1 HEAT repeat domain-containing protein [Gemmatales bacterium]